MKPILFSPVETAFETNGIGVLSDAISCRPVHELNGKYELEIKYPITGLHFAAIQQRSMILAKVDPVSALQPFRVYQITKPSTNVVTVRARHSAYDLAGIPVSPFAADSVGTALNGLSLNAAVDCPFTFSTDKDTEAAFAVKVPTPIWSLLGGSKGGILDTYGGEYEFDRYDVKLLKRLGADRGVSIRYGKNLTSLEQDENCANCYTGIYPYWTNAEGTLVQLPEKVVKTPGTYNYEKVKPVDFTAEWQDAPTEEQLRVRAEKYIADNDIGKPLVSWKIEFVQLEQTKEYKGKALLERVLLGDTVSVEFEDMGVSATSRVVAVDYDSILERYNSVTLGSVKANIASTIVDQNNQIASKPSLTEAQLLTNLILGAMGGAVRLLDTNGDGFPDTLYIADNPDPAQAVKVWRFNYEGWGASENGYNGPFKMGATLEAGMLADFIKAGVISSVDGKIRINLNGASEPIFNTGISTNGFTMRGDSIGAATLLKAYALSVDGRDTIAISFYTDTGVKVAGISNTFNGSTPCGLQYRAYALDKDGKGTNYVDIMTGPDGFVSVGIRDKSDNYIGQFYIEGETNPKSTIKANNATFESFDGKELYWRPNDDGTFTLIGK